MATRILSLRYPTTCCACRRSLPSGLRAHWDADAHRTTCLECMPVQVPEASHDAGTDLGGPPALDGGQAGASADREGRRRHDNRDARIRAAHPHIGGFLLAVSDDPASTKAWAKGAVGERKVAACLDSLARQSVMALHDRRIPGSRANIDHIAIGPSGVFVIDAKRHAGKVTTVSTGSFFRPGPDQLRVGGRDGTKLVEAMAHQVDAVRNVLRGEGAGISVIPMLCFVDAEWPLFPKPLVIDGVWIGWAKAMAEVVAKPGPLGSVEVASMVRSLAEVLRPA